MMIARILSFILGVERVSFYIRICLSLKKTLMFERSKWTSSKRILFNPNEP